MEKLGFTRFRMVAMIAARQVGHRLALDPPNRLSACPYGHPSDKVLQRFTPVVRHLAPALVSFRGMRNETPLGPGQSGGGNPEPPRGSRVEEASAKVFGRSALGEPSRRNAVAGPV
jgi:hypothetical protein